MPTTVLFVTTDVSPSLLDDEPNKTDDGSIDIDPLTATLENVLTTAVGATVTIVVAVLVRMVVVLAGMWEKCVDAMAVDARMARVVMSLSGPIVILVVVERFGG